MKTERLTIEIEFTEPILGLCSGNPEIHHEFIASKGATMAKMNEETSLIPAPNKDEFDAESTELKAMTVFMRDETGLLFLDYQVKGFFKEQVSTLIELGNAPASLNIYNFTKAVDKFVFIYPRRVHLHDLAGHPWKAAPDKLQRPLRCKTMRGERIALASSEVLPIGTTMMFDVEWLVSGNAKTKLCVFDADVIRSCLELGKRSGFGQWRTGGYGRFAWKEVKETP